MKEQILKLAKETLKPIGWHGEIAKDIEGVEKFVEKVLELVQKENQIKSLD
jgi:hypothetical protein